MATDTERRHPYFVEVNGSFDPTDEQLEKGQRFAQGLANMRESLADIEDAYLEVSLSSLNRGLIVVNPSFPIDRTVIRGDGFYEWMSPDERSISAIQLVISSFKLIDRESPLIEARSPGYESTMPVAEIAQIDPTKHQIAVILK